MKLKFMNNFKKNNKEYKDSFLDSNGSETIEYETNIF